MEPPTTSPSVPIDAQGLTALPVRPPSSKFEGRIFSELTGEDGGIPGKVGHASEEALSTFSNQAPLGA